MSAPPSPTASTDAELSIAMLRATQPKLFGRWVLLGILAAAFGYGAASVSIAVEYSVDRMLRGGDPWVVLVSLIAAAVWWRGHYGAAAAMVLSAGWSEMHLTFATHDATGWAAASVALPVFIMLSALWLGARIAQLGGLVTMFSVPAAIWAGGALGLSPGMRADGALVFVVCNVGALTATLMLMTAFLNALGKHVRRAEADEQRVRELLDDAPDAILALDTDDLIEQANPAAARLVGLQMGTLLGRPLRELPIVPNSARWSQTIERLRTGTPVEFLGADGKLRLEGVARARRLSDGRRGMLLVLRDISERWQAEQQARDLQGQLERAQKMEAVGILAGSVAHDFNNLLTAVAGYGALLSSSSDENVREYSTEMLAIQERGAGLVRQLLTFARRETARPRPIDLAATITGLSPLMQRLIGEQVRLSLDTTTLCPVVADPGQVEQVMLNLVANARDAMPDGGELTVRCRREGKRVFVEVSDTGEGMPAELRTRIFEPFFTTKAPGKGTGLGLSTVATIIRETGGDVRVDSDPGRGTRFTLELPATDKAIASESCDSAPSGLTIGAGRHILVAEDNDAVRSYLRRLLERCGFSVTLARSGDEALQLLKDMDRPPELLLSDVIMPGRTGPQVAADARVRFPDLPVLFMSGYPGEAGKRGDFDPVEDLILKPFSDRELMDRIEQKLTAGRLAALA